MSISFDPIAKCYDFLNHIFSFGLDFYWRNRTVQMLKKSKPKFILDLATGTGDLAIALAEKNTDSQIWAVDPSIKMLQIAERKILKRALENRIFIKKGSAEKIPLKNKSVDAVTIAFGIRNVENRQKTYEEIRRVLKPGGILLILEFAWPKFPPLSFLYKIYLGFWMPLVGGIISGNRSAYHYLYTSVRDFPKGEDFLNELKNAGFKETKSKNLSAGIVKIYSAVL